MYMCHIQSFNWIWSALPVGNGLLGKGNPALQEINQ